MRKYVSEYLHIHIHIHIHTYIHTYIHTLAVTALVAATETEKHLADEQWLAQLHEKKGLSGLRPTILPSLSGLEAAGVQIKIHKIMSYEVV